MPVLFKLVQNIWTPLFSLSPSFSFLIARCFQLSFTIPAALSVDRTWCGNTAPARLSTWRYQGGNFPASIPSKSRREPLLLCYSSTTADYCRSHYGCDATIMHLIPEIICYSAVRIPLPAHSTPSVPHVSSPFWTPDLCSKAQSIVDYTCYL